MLRAPLDLWLETLGARGLTAHRHPRSSIEGSAPLSGVRAQTEFVRLIEAFAIAGPAPEFPRIVLGGGALPTRNASMPIYDP